MGGGVGGGLGGWWRSIPHEDGFARCNRPGGLDSTAQDGTKVAQPLLRGTCQRCHRARGRRSTAKHSHIATAGPQLVCDMFQTRVPEGHNQLSDGRTHLDGHQSEWAAWVG